MYLRAPGNETINTVFPKQPPHNCEQVVGAASAFNLVNQLVQKGLIALVGQDDVVSGRRPTVVALEQPKLARAFRADEEVSSAAALDALVNHVEQREDAGAEVSGQRRQQYVRGDATDDDSLRPHSAQLSQCGDQFFEQRPLPSG